VQKWKVVVKVSEKWGVAVKVGAKSEVAMCENGKWWSKWVLNLEWPCSKMESGDQGGYAMGSSSQSGYQI
jgi:hypothetical protein